MLHCFFNNNTLDLPSRVTDTAGNVLADYSYTASGTKVGALDASGNGLLYRGPFVYRKGSGGVAVLESAVVPERRITPSGALLYVRDHLGSVRAVVDGNSGTVLKASAYSAYGSPSDVTAGAFVPETAPAGVTIRDAFSGKEDQQPDFGVPWLDFGARAYSPSLRRWMVPDPLGEKYYGVNPYAYCNGDPVNRIDRSGMDDYRYDDETGTFYFMKRTDDETDRVLGYHKDKDTGEYKPNTRLFQTKIRIEGIEKGILKDGINFKERDNIIAVGGEEQPTVEGVEAFVVELSEMVGLEIAGFEYSLKNESEISNVYIGRYQSSKDSKSRWNTDHNAFASFDCRVSKVTHNEVIFHVQFHTHLSRFTNRDKLRPSDRDLEYKEGQIANGIKRFIILTKGYDPIDY